VENPVVYEDFSRLEAGVEKLSCKCEPAEFEWGCLLRHIVCA